MQNYFHRTYDSTPSCQTFIDRINSQKLHLKLEVSHETF